MLSKKFILIAATALVSGVIAAPAFADVDVTVDVDKTKTITITETIDISKTALITVSLVATAEGLAQTDLLVNARSSFNTVELLLGGSVLVDDDGSPTTPDVASFIKRHASISGSANTNSGVILQLNQDVGDNANQGNLVSAALVDVADNPATTLAVEAAVAHSQVEVDQESTNNNTTWIGTFPTNLPPNDPSGNPLSFHVRADMDGSMNGNTGVILQGNQNAGQNTNQHNAVGLALGIDAGVALAEGALGQESSDNDVLDLNTFKRASITGSMNTNSGIVMFNQSAGHNNNQAAIINIAATTAATSLTPTSTP